MSLDIEESANFMKRIFFNPNTIISSRSSQFLMERGTKNDFVQPINVQFRCKKRRIHEQNTKVFTSGEVLRQENISTLGE